MDYAGFSLFDRSHIIWLIICAISAAASVSAAGRLPENRKKAFSHLLAFSVCLFHLAEILYRYSEGRLNIGTLPLHLCSVSVYLIIVFELKPNRFSEGALFFPGLPGAVCANLFPDWTSYPPFSLLSVIGFLSHLTIICHILYNIRTGRIVPRLRLLFFSVLFITLYSAVMIPFDNRFGVNYGFLLRPAPGSPLEIIDSIFSFRNGYIIGYAAVMLLSAAIWYGLWILCLKLKKSILT